MSVQVKVGNRYVHQDTGVEVLVSEVHTRSSPPWVRVVVTKRTQKRGVSQFDLTIPGLGKNYRRISTASPK